MAKRIVEFTGGPADGRKTLFESVDRFKQYVGVTGEQMLEANRNT